MARGSGAAALSGFRDLARRLPANELVVRLQPEETIYWKVQNKVPGLGFETNQIRMDLLYATKFQQRKLPEARGGSAPLRAVVTRVPLPRRD